MAVAETASLLADLQLQDGLSPGVASALGGVGRLESGVSGLGAKLSGFASNLRGTVSGAVSHFGGRLKDLATAGAGLLGIGGILSIGGLFKSGLDEAREFGGEVQKLAKITGMAIAPTSALASAFHHFGIESDTALRIAGLTEKTLGNLATKGKGLSAFAKQYGLDLRDSKGHVVDFNETILRSADYFNNKNIPATTKAAALAKLFGRNWQELIPVLSAGRRGIADAEAEAKRLGLTLTDDNITALKASKEATRDWNTALGGLKLQIGLNILPLVTDLAKAATGWLIGHKDQIIDFFKRAVDFARSIPKFWQDNISPVISKIKEAWDKIPQPVKDLLIKGIVTDRVIKFAFGVSPIGGATDMIGDLFKGAITGLLGGAVTGGVQGALTKVGLGKFFVQPVFVTNPGFGGGPGGGPGGLLPAAAGGLGASAASIWLGAAGIGILVTAAGMIIARAAYASDPKRWRNPEGSWVDQTPLRPTDRFGKPIAPRATPNQSGSPDDRQERNDQLRFAALRERIEGNRIAIQGMPQTMVVKMAALTQIEDRREQGKFDALRNAIEANRIATVTGARTTTAAGHSDTSRIVGALSALGRLRAVVPITINLPGGGTRTYQGATYLSRTGQIGALQGM